MNPLDLTLARTGAGAQGSGAQGAALPAGDVETPTPRAESFADAVSKWRGKPPPQAQSEADTPEAPDTNDPAAVPDAAVPAVASPPPARLAAVLAPELAETAAPKVVAQSTQREELRIPAGEGAPEAAPPPPARDLAPTLRPQLRPTDAGSGASTVGPDGPGLAPDASIGEEAAQLELPRPKAATTLNGSEGAAPVPADTAKTAQALPTLDPKAVVSSDASGAQTSLAPTSREADPRPNAELDGALPVPPRDAGAAPQVASPKVAPGGAAAVAVDPAHSVERAVAEVADTALPEESRTASTETRVIFQPQPSRVAMALPQFTDQLMLRLAERGGATGGAEIEVRLDPPELGRVRIGFSGLDGALTGVVTAERPEIEALLRRNADALERTLAEAGFSGISLSFGDSRQEHAATPGSRAQNAGLVVEAIAPIDSAPTRPIAAGGLDIRL
ncbi:MAG: flagellar hook-length control protein FliK [Pseudomonadota bacterium]